MKKILLSIFCLFSFLAMQAQTEKTISVTFSDYTGGQQYAENEEHIISDELTIYTTQCHFTTELRIYSSSTHNGYVVSNALPGYITNMTFNAGYKADNLIVYGSNNGETWIEVGKIGTSSSYEDYSLDFAGNYNYFKLDVEGTQQVRIKTLSVTYSTAGGTIVAITPPTITPESQKFNEGESVEVSIINNAEGATLYYSFDGENYREYTGALTITETSSVYAYAKNSEGETSAIVKAEYKKIPSFVEGSVADAQVAYIEDEKIPVRITGYIVGAISGSLDVNDLTGETTVSTNILIADNPNETDPSKCMPVVLPQGYLRNAINIKETPSNYKKKIVVEGMMEEYFSVAGIKSTELIGVYHNVTNVSWGTLFLGYKAEIPLTVEAYKVTSLGSAQAILALVEGVLPANTGVLLKGEGEHLFVVSNESVEEITDNMLKGSVAATEFTDNTYTYYILSNGEEGIGLYPDSMTDGVFLNNANKAYLPVLKDGNNAANYSFNFDWNGTTRIETIDARPVANDVVYDINGRKVEPTLPGLYIVNGKVVVK